MINFTNIRSNYIISNDSLHAVSGHFLILSVSSEDDLKYHELLVTVYGPQRNFVFVHTKISEQEINLPVMESIE